MPIEKRILEETEKIRKDLCENEEFLELERFYIEMKERGIAKVAKYDLPPMDTLGKRFYDIQHSSDKKNMI